MSKIIKKIYSSANWSITGIIRTFQEEFMFRVQTSFGLIQIIIAILVKASLNKILFISWMAVTLVAMELMNTALENITDLVTNNQHFYLAKRAKDSAGAAVFVLSVMSWVITILLLHNELLEFLF